MKTVVYIGMIVAIFVAMAYGSFYIMGGIEGGMPGGGHGKFAKYHKGNKVTSFLEDKSFFGGSKSYNDYTRGDVSSNPFTDQ